MVSGAFTVFCDTAGHMVQGELGYVGGMLKICVLADRLGAGWQID